MITIDLLLREIRDQPNHRGGGGGGGVPPYKRLMGTCRWMGSHFYNCIDCNGVALSKELLEWGHTFSDFWGKKVLHIYG